MDREFKVTFEPFGQSVFVLTGTTLLEAAARAGFVLETPCGGAGKCGKCRVRIVSGKCAVYACETEILNPEAIGQGYRLACQCKVENDLTVEIPNSSLFESEQKILAGDLGEDFKQPPYAGQGKETKNIYGVAVDVGTTTIVGTLVNLRTGEELGVKGLINPQTVFGDDVLSRIRKCREERNGLKDLHDSVLSAVNSIIVELTCEAGIEKGSVGSAVFAGNTAMQEILCGIDPASLGEMPFTPAFKDPLRLIASDFGLEIKPEAEVYIFPQVGGFVGGDTVAGIAAVRIDKSSEPVLFVDIGTNGEIVLFNDGRLTAASAAAGPAFEGARIVNGMRAANGAIEKVLIDDNVHVNVIGNCKPSGICGSGLIDVAAELLRTGILDSTGRILNSDELPDNIPEDLSRRIIEKNDQPAFVLVDGTDTADGGPICVYQKDIRELQLANGAIRAGINILLKKESLKADDVGAVLLAGAFGNYIRRNNAKRIGLLPDMESGRIRFVGNAAFLGAKFALLSSSEREYAEQLMKKTRHQDLSGNPEFQEEFSSAMLFPSQ
ncbi:ASKHA domain-containing protein [Verrucomicrobiota bacterium]